MLQKIKATITGNVVEGKEQLVIRQAGNSKVLNFTLASNNFAPEGKQQTTSFIRVSAFNRDAENLARYLTRGKPLTVNGHMELRPYQSKKYHDDAGHAATMISAELRMEANGFEFISGGSRRQDAQQDAAGVASAEPPADTMAATTKRRRRSKSTTAAVAAAVVAASNGGSGGGVQEVEQPGGPF